jgi:DNA-binding transcriptional LysR family regulator
MASHDRIRRRLKLRDLDTLMMVAKEGSMAKAAAGLSVSQPAVSKAMAEMERTLGVRLLDRTAQGVEPNLYGRALLKWAAAIFDDVRQGVNELEFLNDPTSGEVRIGATEPVIAGLLSEAIRRLSRPYPKIVFHITQIPVFPPYREVRERSVDFMIGHLAESTAPDEVNTEILFDEPQFIVAGLNNPLARRRKIKLAELRDEPWTLPRPETAAGTLAADTFRRCGLGLPHTRVICNSIQMHNALLATGEYLAMFPRSLLEFGAQRLSITVLPVDLPASAAPLGIITLKNRTLSPVTQLVIECVREVARPLAARQPRLDTAKA